MFKYELQSIADMDTQAVSGPLELWRDVEHSACGVWSLQWGPPELFSATVTTGSDTCGERRGLTARVSRFSRFSEKEQGSQSAACS